MMRRDVVLATLATAEGQPHSPVQVQKLLFLIDREGGDLVDDGPHFNFRPYHYGPFDRAVYRELEALAAEGFVTIDSTVGWKRSYALTPTGQRAGDRILADLPAAVRDYIQVASDFVRRLSFIELVSAIYQRYPEMRENSVIRPAS